MYRLGAGDRPSWDAEQRAPRPGGALLAPPRSADAQASLPRLYPLQCQFHAALALGLTGAASASACLISLQPRRRGRTWPARTPPTACELFGGSPPTAHPAPAP